MRLAHIVSFFSGLFSSTEKKSVSNSIYDFKIKSLGGKEVDFSQYRGQKLLLVNTASKCGFTTQYEGLNKVKVLGFPANNFLRQEPGTNQQIAEFCVVNYGVSFPMFEKISVKGADQHPLYQWLEAKTGKRPDWNFAKYLVSADGNEVVYFKAGVQPLDKRIIELVNS